MKRLLSIVWIASLACQPGGKTEKDSKTQAEPADTVFSATGKMDTSNWDYSGLYGTYLHEGNTKGFTAILELTPQGNDLSFTLRTLQGNCEASLDGTIGMIYHGEDEYAGFFDSEPCRLAFNFFINENKIRVDEIGLCRAHPPGCSFAGTYGKRATAP
jgi:hypothetical protein